MPIKSPRNRQFQSYSSELALRLGGSKFDVYSHIDHSRTKTKSPQTTDVVDKCFLAGSGLFFLAHG
jgi:hypothetical protein